MADGAQPTVVSVRRLQRGRHAVVSTSDGRELLVPSDTLETTGVVEGAPLDEAALGLRDASEQQGAAHETALRLLAHRARSEQEMRKRLGLRGYPPAIVDAEVRRLRAAGLLNDEQFARAWVEDRLTSAPRGRRLLRYELLGHGVPAEVADAVTTDVDDHDVALMLARRRAARLSGLDRSAFESRLGSYLQRKGLGYGVIAEVTRTVWAEIEEAAAAPDS